MFHYTVLLISIFITSGFAEKCTEIGQLSVNGSCYDCPPGFHGFNCSKICPSGYYGNLCTQVCRCTTKQICDDVIGCIQDSNTNCTEENCIKQCPVGYFTNNCENCTCPNGSNETDQRSQMLRWDYIFIGIGISVIAVNGMVCYCCKRGYSKTRGTPAIRDGDGTGASPNELQRGLNADQGSAEEMANIYSVSNDSDYNALSFSGRRNWDHENVLHNDFHYDYVEVNTDKEAEYDECHSRIQNDYGNIPTGRELARSCYSLVEIV